MIDSTRFRFEAQYFHQLVQIGSYLLFQLGDVSCMSDYVGEKHKQRVYEITYVVSGEGACLVNDRRYPLKAGTVFINTIGDTHQMETTAWNPLRFMYIGFIMQENTTDPDVIALERFFANPPVRCADDAFDIQNCFVELFSEFTSTDTLTVSMKECCLHRLLCQVYRQVMPERKKVYQIKDGQKASVNELVYDMAHYIDEHAGAMASLRELCGVFGYSYTYLASVFSRVMQKSLNAYATQRRFEKACLCLQNGQTVTETAAQTGYQTVHAFSNAFKKSMGCSPSAYQRSAPRSTPPRPIRPLEGSWFSVCWSDRRHVYLNDPCTRYTAEHWDALLMDMRDMGVRDLVMCHVLTGGAHGRETAVSPEIAMACADPTEEVFRAADKYGMRIYMTDNESDCPDPRTLLDPQRVQARATLLEQQVRRYGHHPSFFGWYWSAPALLSPYFSEPFIRYVNGASHLGRQLMPASRVLIAPKNARSAGCDDVLLRQLENLDADVIAYQDTVGAAPADTDASRQAFEALRRLHDRLPQRRLYADLETFAWEGDPDRNATPFLPVPFPRLVSHLEALSPYVEHVYAFLVQGLFSNPDSIAYTGYPPAARYYRQYTDWLKNGRPPCRKQPAET
ncbi:MAG: DUF4434 domain-containing protein [Clostridiales bacterium]|nr:DUF4434 domain-containing protein [Clostridiales bacterium]